MTQLSTSLIAVTQACLRMWIKCIYNPRLDIAVHSDMTRSLLQLFANGEMIKWEGVMQYHLMADLNTRPRIKKTSRNVQLNLPTFHFTWFFLSLGFALNFEISMSAMQYSNNGVL